MGKNKFTLQLKEIFETEFHLIIVTSFNGEKNLEKYFSEKKILSVINLI